MTLWTPGQPEIISEENKLEVILTSFDRADKHPGHKFNIARWQPNGRAYRDLQWLAPRDVDDGADLKHLEPDIFREKYENVLDHWGWATRQFFIGCLGTVGLSQIVLCCWCNFRRQAQYEKLYCHSILLGYWLEDNIPGIKVHYLEGRDKPLWERQTKADLSEIIDHNEAYDCQGQYEGDE